MLNSADQLALLNSYVYAENLNDQLIEKFEEAYKDFISSDKTV